MNKFLSTSAAMAAIAGVGFSAYTIGQANSKEPAKAITLIISDAISGLPKEQRESAENLLSPILRAAESKGPSNYNKKQISEYTMDLKNNFKEISLVSYQADKSPFSPPKNKVQMLCKNKFTFAYTGKEGKDPVKTNFKINGRGTGWMSPGDINYHTSEGMNLTITYMEYSKQLNGPIIKYDCIITE